MSKDSFKHQIFNHFALIGKALSSPNRLELIDFLMQGERNVESLSKISGLTFANTSRHLQQLKIAGLVNQRKEGQQVFYSISGDRILSLMEILRKVAEENNAAVTQLMQKFLEDKDMLEPIEQKELASRLKNNEIILIDVRPREEYISGHIKGAINLPMEQLKDEMEKFPDDKEIIAYCRGPYCVLSILAVRELRKKGKSVRRLKTGFPEWKLANLPVEK